MDAVKAFKKGDIVKYVGVVFPDLMGREGEVTGRNATSVYVDFKRTTTDILSIFADELEFVALATEPVEVPVLEVPIVAPTEATKDTNPKDAIGDKKVPLWLLSPIAKAQWAVAQFVGMVKYGAWNWREAGVRSSIYLSAMQRHMDAYLSGEEVDPVDGTPHLGHIMACAAILIDAKAAGKLTDDRPPSVGIRDHYAEVEAQMVKARENYGHLNPRHYTIKDTK